MYGQSVELRVPIEGVLVIDTLGGIMQKQDNRKNNGGKTKGKHITEKVKAAKRAGPDQYVPGQPFRIAKSLKGKWEVKDAKVPFVCVTKDCTNPVTTRKGKWCADCFAKVRAIAMDVNKKRWLKKKAKAAKKAA